MSSPTSHTCLGVQNYQLYQQYAAEYNACAGYGKRHLLEDGPRRLLREASPTVVANCNAAYEAALANAQAVGVRFPFKL